MKIAHTLASEAFRESSDVLLVCWVCEDTHLRADEGRCLKLSYQIVLGREQSQLHTRRWTKRSSHQRERPRRRVPQRLPGVIPRRWSMMPINTT